MRALLAGLSWEKGLNYDYRSLAETEAKIGLGSVTGEEGYGEASKLILDTDVIEVRSDPLSLDKFRVSRQYITRSRAGKARIDLNRVLHDYMSGRVDYRSEPWKVLLSIPRYALLVTGKDPYEGVPKELFLRQPLPPNSLELVISLRARRRVSDEVKLLCSAALVLALTLGGIGQATSRGFGKMRINVIGGDTAEISRKVVKEVKEASSNLVGNIIKILKENGVDKLINGGRRGGSKGLPRIPTFHPDVMRVEVIRNPKYRPWNVRNLRNVWDVLVVAGRACLKVDWKRLARTGIKASGRDLHTWPLGLPRYVKGTGYAMIVDKIEVPGRLTSLVRFTPLQRGNGGNVGVIVYAFKTGDLSALKQNLYHLEKRRGKGRVRLPVRELRVLDPVSGRVLYPSNPVQYLDVAFETVVEILT